MARGGEADSREITRPGHLTTLKHGERTHPRDCRINHGRKLSGTPGAPTPHIRRQLWRMEMMSPSCTTYSFPSSRQTAASFARANELPWAMKWS